MTCPDCGALHPGMRDNKTPNMCDDKMRRTENEEAERV